MFFFTIKRESSEKNSNMSELNIEHGQAKQAPIIHEQALTSAHTIDHDSWQQVGLMLVMSFNCGYILSFSNLMLVPLGWTWGIICLVVVGCFTAYANWLLAGFHFIHGQRFIRYRDLMGHLYGRKMYYVTWVSQYLTLILGNMGIILLGGRALKVKGETARMKAKLWHWANIVVFSVIAVVTTVSAVRLILNNIRDYSFFADT